MKKEIERVLSFISPDLQTLKDDYFVIGSCALILSGVPIEKTSDLDLMVSHEDAEKLKSLWVDRRREYYEPSNQDIFRSNFARFDFGELDVEVMGELEVFRNNEWKSLRIENYVEVLLGEQKVKIPTLEEQKRIFYFFGREKDKLKAQLIERYL